jgi:opacity protein-like surface antigen
MYQEADNMQMTARHAGFFAAIWAGWWTCTFREGSIYLAYEVTAHRSHGVTSPSYDTLLLTLLVLMSDLSNVRLPALLVLTLFLCMGAQAPTAQAQSDDASSRFTLGVGPALLSTVSATQTGAYQTYGVGARAEMRVGESLSIGLTGGLFRATDHRTQGGFTQSAFTRRVVTGTLRAQLDVYATSAFRIYGITGIAMHHADQSGEMLLFNDAPPYGTSTQPISESAPRWGPQIGGGLALMRFQGVRVYAEPTFTALLPDAIDFGRVQLDVGVRLPL